MLHNQTVSTSESREPVPVTRIGDVAAMLRIMRPLNSLANSTDQDPAAGKRRLLADLCRFIGVKVGSLPHAALGLDGPVTEETQLASSARAATPAAGISPGELPPRQEQTLVLLLDGYSEKQVARKLELSQHTVHVYVKALYRRFGVSSRAELLAKQLKK